LHDGAEAGVRQRVFSAFGPVAPLYRFRTDDEAVKIANDTPTLTLSGCRGGEGGASRLFFCSRDIGRIWRVAEALVGISEVIISAKSTGEIAPFGGMRKSGIRVY